MKAVTVGIIGLGTVGAGTAETLLKQRGLIEARTGIPLILKKAADLNLDRDFGFDIPKEILTRDAREVIQDPDIQIVVELIGGTTIAKTFVLEALAAGKSVVTANKALLAEHGSELMAAAEAAGVDLFFEAAVAGGIPIIKALREGLVANPITRICGIMNGTCNYILTRMEQEGIGFDEVLLDAQQLGFAEAEPGLDVDGWDTAHKAVILSQIAFGVPLKLSEVPVEGIRGISPQDVHNAAELGYRIKLLAMLDQSDQGYSVSVQPVLIPDHRMLSSVNFSYNAILVEGEVVGETLYYGKGAGRLPTASSVVADIVDAARDWSGDSHARIPLSWDAKPAPKWIPVVDRLERSYVRLFLKDEPGSLAIVAQCLGNHGISITALVQHEGEEAHKFIPVVILTNEAPVGAIRHALEELSGLPEVGGEMVRYRLEDLPG
ncbi:MAG: homoserine dehydrogenase [Kiritimatiellae bacterium]|jgi:homoserine dehydrogenase|nr:homoserine dehydrogenase [Kiritimatiellia bacterium]